MLPTLPLFVALWAAAIGFSLFSNQVKFVKTALIFLFLFAIFFAAAIWFYNYDERMAASCICFFINVLCIAGGCSNYREIKKETEQKRREIGGR